MAFKMSPNIAIYAAEIKKAVAYYVDTLGFDLVSQDDTTVELKAGPNTLFLMEDDQFAGAVHELFVDDLETARDVMVSHGAKVLRWRGKGQDCYVEDPFGVVFNLWEH